MRLVRKGLHTCGFSRSCSIIIYHTIMTLAHYEFFSVNYNLPGRFCKKLGPLKLCEELDLGIAWLALRCSTFRRIVYADFKKSVSKIATAMQKSTQIQKIWCRFWKFGVDSTRGFLLQKTPDYRPVRADFKCRKLA